MQSLYPLLQFTKHFHLLVYTCCNNYFVSLSDCSAWLKSCETSCTQTSDSPIPKHVHFISISRPFSFHEWLAVMSARKKIKPDKITVYTDGQQDSCWWRRALPYIQHQQIHLLPGSIVVNGVSIKKMAHIADFLRVSILYHEGGIYMDTDSVTLNSFDPLLSNQVVLATDCNNCVANGVMMAQKHSCFICKYAHRSCQKFDGGWTTHSVNTMNAFVKEVDTKKEGLLVLPARGGFYPMCWTPEGFHQLYSEDFDNISHYKKTEIYAVHLFANRGEATTFPKTVNNIDWIHNNKSLVAIAIRESLPSEFSEHHLNTRECASLPFDD